MSKKVYVFVDGTPAELLGINSADPDGKYNVQVAGDKTNKRVKEVGLRCTHTQYTEALVAKSTKTRRSKK